MNHTPKPCCIPILNVVTRTISPAEDCTELQLSLALDLLDKHQFSYSRNAYTYCPECKNFQRSRHERNCALARLLERHGKEVRWEE